MKLKNILNESKQVGIIYHYTTIGSLISILKTLTIKDSYEFERGYVSFTRSGSGIVNLRHSLCRIVIDGNRLSNKYKIIAHSQGSSRGQKGPIRDPKNKQAEERIYQKEVDISKCIICVDILKDYANDEVSKLDREFIKSKTQLNIIDKFHPHSM